MIGLVSQSCLFGAEDAKRAQSSPSYIFAVQRKYGFDMRLELSRDGKRAGLKNPGESLDLCQCLILLRDDRRDALFRGLDAVIRSRFPVLEPGMDFHVVESVVHV